ncbi:von Willebrand factor A domain-containing protein 7 [Procambarus clarkii]|uniref:von Willebrand factor A domain-containing protein 7 n=1 Tax=Procambarus clarkii TaxID=6728 RepID=UPI001E6746ED|nr:von Willebrand factor A domain-containing protein 7-like [Procambarus clarkii]
MALVRRRETNDVVSVWLLLAVMVVTPRPTTAFLGRGTLLETQGDIFDIYCTGFDRGTTVWHHREITREAIRRVVIRYFQEVTPAEGSYDHRVGMTLEEAYSEYYGDSRSPKPFLDTVSKLADAVAEADTGLLGADPRYHFGNERFSETQQLLSGRWRRIVKAGDAGDYSSAIHLLGLSLAAIQDFYSNTNWIELGNTDFNPDVGVPSKEFKNVAGIHEDTCKDCPEAADGAGSCPNNLLKEIMEAGKLTSGYTDNAFVNNERVQKPRDVNKCSHGGPRDRSRGAGGARGGINKELPTACFSPHHSLHQQAAQQAIKASEYYINLVRGGVGDATFSRLLGLHPTPALVLVLDTTDSMDKELLALRRSVSRLVQQHEVATYPPAEYVFVPFNDPLYGPVTRSRRPEEIYNALTQLRAIGGGDEAELSMSALNLALHTSPPHSQVYLFTDASIKDPELFDAVITLALSKSIKVTPVITMPLLHGGITGRLVLELEDNLRPEETSLNRVRTRQDPNIRSRSSSSNISSRKKRQLQSFEKYNELAQRTGGQVIETTGDKVEETARILEETQYPLAILRRVFDVTTSQTVRIPVDSLVQELEVSISGGVTTATLNSPSGNRFDLKAQPGSVNHQGYTVVDSTPYHIQVRINMAQRKDFGSWTLKFEPVDGASAVVYAKTSLDILPVFYTPDFRSNQPSLQRVLGQPSRGVDMYLNVAITGVDRAGLRSLGSVFLRDENGKEFSLELPNRSPRRNTYFSLSSKQLPTGMFTVVLSGEDGTGRAFRRESGTVLEMVESSLSFVLGRDIWGPPGSVLTIPVSITNTNANSVTANTYFITAHDAFGSVVKVDQTPVKLGRNETATLGVKMTLDQQVPPHTTNSLVVTATSTQGHTSQALAHVSVTPKFTDITAPYCDVLSKTSCADHLSPDTCSSLEWSAGFSFRDSGVGASGIGRVVTIPAARYPPVFSKGDTNVQWTYSASCCDPTLSVSVYDVAGNVGVCSVDNTDDSGGGDNAKLKSGEIAGIVVGSVLGLVLLILLVILIVVRVRRSKKEDITLRRHARRTEE